MVGIVDRSQKDGQYQIQLLMGVCVEFADIHFSIRLDQVLKDGKLPEKYDYLFVHRNICNPDYLLDSRVYTISEIYHTDVSANRIHIDDFYRRFYAFMKTKDIYVFENADKIVSVYRPLIDKLSKNKNFYKFCLLFNMDFEKGKELTFKYGAIVARKTFKSWLDERKF